MPPVGIPPLGPLGGLHTALSLGSHEIHEITKSVLFQALQKQYSSANILFCSPAFYNKFVHSQSGGFRSPPYRRVFLRSGYFCLVRFMSFSFSYFLLLLDLPVDVISQGCHAGKTKMNGAVGMAWDGLGV